MYIYPSSPDSASSLQSEESAAIKIQAGFRGYRVRKQLHRQRKPSSNGYRHSSNRRQQRYHHHNSSNMSDEQKHQSQQHQQQIPKCANDANRTASPAAADVSGVMTSVEDRCATKIQAGVRGFLVRKKQKIATDAAVKIQASFRGFKVRKDAQKLKQQ